MQQCTPWKILNLKCHLAGLITSWLNIEISSENLDYCISSVIGQSFFSFQNNLKNLDPSYKMDLDIWDCLGRVKLVL